jgi:pseudouridine-5'-phosphate glycosidase
VFHIDNEWRLSSVTKKLPKNFRLSIQVARALETGQPVIALESAVISHGLPYPQNLETAQDMEQIIKSGGVVPATVAILKGEICIGLNIEQLKFLAQTDDLYKISRRDIALAIIHKKSGGTTVAGTLIAARAAGIHILATGGIGGVHRYAPFDISPDLPELGRTPMIVVCAGAKAILDLPATLEYLETLGVPVLGYQTDDFPAFYIRRSGLKVMERVDSPEEIVNIARTHWELGLQSAILVVVPVPDDAALPEDQMESAITQAVQEAEHSKISGQAMTPFLLKRVAELTYGDSLKANLALLKNNALIAAAIANAFPRTGIRWV